MTSVVLQTRTSRTDTGLVPIETKTTRQVYNLFQEPVEQSLLGFRIAEGKSVQNLTIRETDIKTTEVVDALCSWTL